MKTMMYQYLVITPRRIQPGTKAKCYGAVEKGTANFMILDWLGQDDNSYELISNKSDTVQIFGAIDAFLNITLTDNIRRLNA